MATTQTHEDNIEIAITQAPLPVGDQKFQTILIMRDGIAFDGGTERVRTYASVVAAEADEALAEIDATTTALITAALAQPNVAQVKVGKVNTAALETYVDALTAILAQDCEFWAIVLDVRTAAIQVAMVTQLEALADLSDGFRGYLIFQSSDTDWATTGIPAAYSTLASLSRWAVVYHDTDTEVDDVRWAANRTAFDPDDRSTSWDSALVGGTSFATDLTAAQKIFLDDNYANHVLPYGTEARWIDGGFSGDGAFVHEALTTDWFHVRMMQDITTAKARYSARGRKWPMDETGKSIYKAIISGRLQQGVAAEHFKAEQFNVAVETISATDLSLGRLRATAEATYLGSARKFRLDVEFGREDVNPAA